MIEVSPAADRIAAEKPIQGHLLQRGSFATSPRQPLLRKDGGAGLVDRAQARQHTGRFPLFTTGNLPGAIHYCRFNQGLRENNHGQDRHSRSRRR